MNNTYIITTEKLWPSKIGYGKNPWKRLSSLQVGCWERLQMFMILPHHRSFLIERDVKAILEKKKLNGEWYNTTPLEMAEELIKVYKGYPNTMMTAREQSDQLNIINNREYFDIPTPNTHYSLELADFLTMPLLTIPRKL